MRIVSVTLFFLGIGIIIFSWMFAFALMSPLEYIIARALEIYRQYQIMQGGSVVIESTFTYQLIIFLFIGISGSLNGLLITAAGMALDALNDIRSALSRP